MPRDIKLSKNEQQFIAKGLSEGFRLDGRNLDQYRPMKLGFGEEYGSVEVSFGKTIVAARVSCSLTVPYPERKFDGVFNINCEFSPMASPAFEVGRANVDEVLLSRILDKTLRRSSALDTESLCLVAGSKCFALRADIHILQHDGNLVDASCLALLAALRHFRRPDVSVDGETVIVYDPKEREPIPLSMLHHPLCVTVSYFEENVLLLDASAAEEQIRLGDVTISMNPQGELCQLMKNGGAEMDVLDILRCTALAYQKVKILSKFLQTKLDEDVKKRDAGGIMAELSAENERPQVDE